VSDLADLARHPMITNPRTFPNGICNLARAQKSFTVRLNVEISITNYWAIREVMLEDGGIALLPSFCVKDEIESGVVERVLPAYLLQQGQVSAVYPHYEHIPKRAKLFTRFIQQRFARAFQMD
jgi:DNA-binding transcriptional LysR family regulator